MEISQVLLRAQQGATAERIASTEGKEDDLADAESNNGIFECFQNVVQIHVSQAQLFVCALQKRRNKCTRRKINYKY